MSKRSGDSRTERAQKAADQMWKALKSGLTYEVPASLSTEDNTVRALLILKAKHPNVVTTMLQSKGIVLTLGKPASVSSMAWNTLGGAGYFPTDELPADVFFGQHAQFMRRAGVNPQTAVRQAQKEDRERNSIVISSK